jgi:transposase
MPKKKPPARRRYATDLTDTQWELIAPMIPDDRADSGHSGATYQWLHRFRR